jgi:hypothetical protein
MPTFETPDPISVTIEIGVGNIRIAASDRSDTVVEVRPSSGARKVDVELAEETRVELAAGSLLIRAPRGWRYFGPFGSHGSIDVDIAMPAGSRVSVDSGIGPIYALGRLGECRCKTGFGDIAIEHATTTRLHSGGGDVSLDRAEGFAEVSTGTGTVRIGAADGGAAIKNSNGATWIGSAGGDLRVKAANGSIDVDRALASVDARSANGAVRIAEVARGRVVAETAAGRVEIGVRDGVAAYLDLDTRFGTLSNDLDAAAGPEPHAETVEVRARTGFGDIVINRSFTRDTLREEA